MKDSKKLNEKQKQELLDHALFKGLSVDSIKEIISDVVVTAKPSGVELIRQGKHFNYFYIVLKGALQGFISDKEGKNTIVSLFKEGNLCGEENFFTTDGLGFPYHIETLKKTYLIMFQKESFKNHLMKNPTLANNMLYLVGQKNISMQRRMEGIINKTPLQRIGGYILENAVDNTISFHFNKSIVANYLGMSPETFSRNFSKLKDLFSIKTENNKLVIQNTSAMCGFCTLDFAHKCIRRKPNT